MIRRAASHALMAVLTVVVAVCAMQGLLELAPGDPIDLLPNASAVRSTLEAQWGLDRPVHERIIATLTGDLGTSLSVRPGEPVRALIARPLLASLGWWLCAGAGLTLVATATALRRGRLSRIGTLILGGLSLFPVFLLAHVVVGTADESVVALTARGLIDRPAWFPLPLEPSFIRFAVATGVLALGSASFLDAHTELSTRVNHLRSSAFAEAAASRGEPESSWLWRHVAIAVVELIASRAPVLIGGLVILEKVLLLSGAGSLLWNATIARDYPVALALTAAFAAWVALTRALTDIARDGLLRGQPSS